MLHLRSWLRPNAYEIQTPYRASWAFIGDQREAARMHDDVMAELKRHLESAEQIDVSRYQFINIDSVRNAAGPLWPSLRERVFVASRSIVERRVAEDDLIIPCNTGYLVIFKALSGDAAAKLTEQIREEMERFFLGEALIDQLRVDASSDQLTVDEFTAQLANADVSDPTRSNAAEPDDGPDEPPHYDELVFAPIWDAQREAVASYFARPRRRCPNTESWKTGAALLDGVRRVEDLLAFDQAVLNDAANALSALIDTGSRCAVIAPAHFSVLSNPRTRSIYVTALAGLPKALQRLIWVRIDGAPPDAPAATLAETGRILLSHTPQLFLHATVQTLDLSRLNQAGATALGADFPNTASEGARQDMERFLALAGRAPGAVYFDGVDHWEAVRSASRTSAGLIAGRAIAEPGGLRPPYRLSRNAILARAA